MTKRRLTPGQRIAMWRRIRGLTVRALAGKVGVAYSALSRMEHGHQRVPADVIERVAFALGMTVGEIYGEPASDEAA